MLPVAQVGQHRVHRPGRVGKRPEAGCARSGSLVSEGREAGAARTWGPLANNVWPLPDPVGFHLEARGLDSDPHIGQPLAVGPPQGVTVPYPGRLCRAGALPGARCLPELQPSTPSISGCPRPGGSEALASGVHVNEGCSQHTCPKTEPDLKAGGMKGSVGATARAGSTARCLLGTRQPSAHWVTVGGQGEAHRSGPERAWPTLLDRSCWRPESWEPH